jgi:cytochrome P450
MGEPTVDLSSDPAGVRTTLAAAASTSHTAVDVTTGALFVLRYEELERLAHDVSLAGVGLTYFDAMGIRGDLRDWYGALMFTNEGETHSRMRRLVSRAFTPRSVEQLRPKAAQLVNDAFLDLDSRREGDLMKLFGYTSVRVMCQLLGVPDGDVGIWGSWADALSPVFGYMDPGQIVAAESALVELVAYLATLLEERDAERCDDLISALLRAEEDGERLGRDEVINMVTNLLVAAHDTTTSQIGCTLLTLLSHPAAVARLRVETELVPAAVTETMRYEPSIGLIPRTTTAPIEIGGTERPAGTMVVLSVITANRDPEEWEDPDSFVVDRFTRPGAPHLLSFGTGVHYCLGANLARITLEETVAAFVGKDLARNKTSKPSPGAKSSAVAQRACECARANHSSAKRSSQGQPGALFATNATQRGVGARTGSGAGGSHT